MAKPTLGGRFSVRQVEKEHIRQVLAGTRDYKRAAKTLGISQSTLYRLRQKDPTLDPIEHPAQEPK